MEGVPSSTISHNPNKKPTGEHDGLLDGYLIEVCYAGHAILQPEVV